MSISTPQRVAYEAVDAITPVRIEAEKLETTDPEYLRDLKFDFAQNGLVPAEMVISGYFDAGTAQGIRLELDAIKEYIRAAAFIGISQVCISIESPKTLKPTDELFTPYIDYARKEGISLHIKGPSE